MGIYAAQLVRLCGADVIGTCGETNVDLLASLGIRPAQYGPSLSRRLRDLAPNGIDGYVDTFGSGNVSLAVSLGVEPDRINTLIDQEAVQRFGVRSGTTPDRRSHPHLGDFLGIAPTGKTIQFKTVDAMRVRNGQITDHWGVANLYSVLQQLGQLPST